MSSHYLLDVNVLIALADVEHEHFPAAVRWFDSDGYRDWGVCPLTEVGFARVTTNPVMGSHIRTVDQAAQVLAVNATKPGYRFWPMTESWAPLTSPFASRIFGHQQVTDAYLLGLAVKENGVLVTFDRALKYLAGDEFRANLLVLE